MLNLVVHLLNTGPKTVEFVNCFYKVDAINLVLRKVKYDCINFVLTVPNLNNKTSNFVYIFHL